MATLARHRQAWLLEIGQRLKVEYDALAATPIPSRLDALIRRLESIPELDTPNALAVSSSSRARPGA
jgi:hypothetical protein